MQNFNTSHLDDDDELRQKTPQREDNDYFSPIFEKKIYMDEDLKIEDNSPITPVKSSLDAAEIANSGT